MFTSKLVWSPLGVTVPLILVPSVNVKPESDARSPVVIIDAVLPSLGLKVYSTGNELLPF